MPIPNSHSTVLSNNGRLEATSDGTGRMALILDGRDAMGHPITATAEMTPAQALDVIVVLSAAVQDAIAP